MPDFNDVGPQRAFDVIPAGTIATVEITIRPGGAGDGGWLRRSKDGGSEGLDLELTVVDGTYAKRKFWCLLTLTGTTLGHGEAGDISRRRIRGILESARGVRPDDKSDAAKAARQIASYGDLDGLRFIARIGVEPAQGNYRAKNTLDEAVTPDKQAWRWVEQVPKPVSSAAQPSTSASPAAPVTPPAALDRPAWAR
jgi:hypothetical protein